jgi:EmrB/QacA subfamily drug resistance transporter
MPATQPRRGAVLATVLTAMFMAVLDVFIVNVANPAIQRDLDAPASAIEWIVAGYVLAYAVMLITGGRLGDAFGRRRMFRAGVSLFTVASAACAAAPSVGALIAARVVQGLGAALMQPQVYSIVQVEFAAHERPRAFALMGTVMGGASIAGQLIGGALIALADWRAVFAINLPVGLACVVVAGRIIPESRAEHARRLDLRGVLLGTIALLLVVAPVVQGREAGWPWWVPAAVAAAVPVGALFVAHERALIARGGAPLVDLDLFARPAFRRGIALVLVFWMAVPVYFLALAQYLQLGHGMSPILSGVVFTPLAVAFFFASLAGPKLALRPWPRDRVMAYGALMTVFGALLGAAVVGSAGDALPTVPLLVALTIMGTGQGFVMPGALAAALHGVPVASAGSASGVVTTTQQTAAVLGVALGGTLFFGLAGDPPSASGFGDALAAMGAWTAAGALVAAALAWRPRATSRSADGHLQANSQVAAPSSR